MREFFLVWQLGGTTDFRIYAEINLRRYYKNSAGNIYYCVVDLSILESVPSTITHFKPRFLRLN
jgi:hypothetical protein